MGRRASAGFSSLIVPQHIANSVSFPAESFDKGVNAAGVELPAQTFEGIVNEGKQIAGGGKISSFISGTGGKDVFGIGQSQMFSGQDISLGSHCPR